MASGHEREIESLRAGLDRWLTAHGDRVPGWSRDGGGGDGGGGSLRVHDLSHATAGLANETVMVDLGPAHQGIVLRLPPLEPSFPVYDLATQAVVMGAVAAAGVPAPAPAIVESDESWIGTPFLVMPRVRGDIPGPAPIFDQWILGLSVPQQRRLHDGMIDMLAAIHGVPWSIDGLVAALPGPTLRDTLDYWTGYVEWAGGGAPLPILVDGLAWCLERIPDEGEPVLVWGDARLGNLVFDADLGVHAVLDWELAAIGPREMDLGWYLGLDAMMEDLFGQRVPGFPDRAETVALYEARSGHVIERLEWHEVFALVRALAINDRQQRVAAASGQAYMGAAKANLTQRSVREDPLAGVFGAPAWTPAGSGVALSL